MTIDAFVSYAKPDLARVEELCAGLIARGSRLWIDTEDLELSTPWRDAVRSGIASAQAVVLAVSPAWVASKACRYELNIAREKSKPLVPVLVSEPAFSSDLSAVLRTIDLEVIDCGGSLQGAVDIVAKQLERVTAIVQLEPPKPAKR